MKWVSDDQYIEDFDDEFMEANLASALESNLSFSWNTPFGNVTAQGSTYQDLLSVDPLSPDNHIVHQVPQLSGSFFPVILFEDFPLLAAVDISYLHLTNFSSFSGSLSDNVNSHYFELSPRFSLPLDIGVTQFMPQFGLREALLNNSVSEQLKSSLSADVGFELSVNMQKIFQTQWGGALSHFMEPKMKYSFNSWLYNEPDFLEQFRPVPSQHEFSFLIDNDVYQKQYRVNQENFILVDTKYVKVFEFDITQPLNMAVIAAGGLNIFNDLTSHMNLSVSPFNFGTELSMNTNQMALKQLTVTSSFGYAFPFLGAGANMKMNAMNFSLDEFGANIETSDPWSNSYAAAYKKTKDKSGDFDLSFGMGFLAWMTLSAVSTYSLDSGNFLKHSAKLEINPFSRCWKLGVDFGHSLDKGFSVNAAFTLIFGVEQQLPMVGYKSESGVGGIQWFPKNSS
ncbi:MAG: LPS assembly protein LptD [Deltaproteobacteria bacterium]|nr:LPS assembly protein LptD [Deltaproteobacteria bacterium]